MARPAGPIRQAVALTAERLVEAPDGPRYGGRPAVTYQDLQAHLVPAGVGRKAVRTTLARLVRDGALEFVAEVTLEHSRRPLKAYAPARGNAPPKQLQLGAELQALLYGEPAVEA